MEYSVPKQSNENFRQYLKGIYGTLLSYNKYLSKYKATEFIVVLDSYEDGCSIYIMFVNSITNIGITVGEFSQKTPPNCSEEENFKQVFENAHRQMLLNLNSNNIKEFDVEPNYVNDLYVDGFIAFMIDLNQDTLPVIFEDPSGDITVAPL